MSGYKLVEAVKIAKNLSSDNQVADLIGKHRMNISNWKNTDSKPDADTAMLLTEMAGLSVSEGRKLLNAGFASVSLLVMTSLAGIALLAWYYVTVHCILCKINDYLKRQNHLPCRFA